ncbi:MAG: UDP-N-acetylmuramate dehydrogenase [Endomicrobiia bacterium]|nr:MAG: UDP-N-acetylmuramate dehydrogenase [Endomicrobiia bacterium]
MEERRRIVDYNLIKILSSLGCKVLRDELLLKHCSFKIGGPADLFIEIPNECALLEFLKIVSDSDKYYILGEGTNVLFSDEGYRGIVICLTEDFRKNYVLENQISCGGGTLISDLLETTIKNNLTGLEYLTGIPGTVGGAVYGNAGIKDEWISTSISSIEIYKNLKKQLINKGKIRFGYRESGLEDCVITKVNFSLKKSIKNNSLKKICRNMQNRLKTQPLNMPNAGSIFRNPSGCFSAGKLIEYAGLKGKRIGCAQISELHGNFIINRGGAIAKDVLCLIDLIKEKVKEKFNINLETEIKIIK